MPRIAYFDAFSGIAGDMTVGALIDAGASATAVMDSLNALATGATYAVEKTIRGGVTGSKFRVTLPDLPAKHRHLHHIVDMIEKTDLAPQAKANAIAVFTKLGEAEAGVHGVEIKKVHFHEVGAADSIADIVGACVALDLLDVHEVHMSAINVGSGTVMTEHGLLPVPAPATARLLEGKPVYAKGPEMELTTPTGAAIAATLSKTFGPMPAMKITSLGYGAGDKDFKHHANVLRVILGDPIDAPESTMVSVIEANIDDSSPQILGYALDKLMAAGALDVALSPLQMKKNRPGSLLKVIARPEDQERLAQIILAETSTLGLRIQSAERRVSERHMITVQTQYGAIRGKVSGQGAFAPEYDDCRAIAEQTGTPLPQVMAAATAAYLSQK